MTKYLIIGAGPAGLAAAVALQQADIAFDMVDAGNKVGGIWDIQREDTPMYQSAHFISSRTLSGFENYPMPANYPDYPSHTLVQSYIEDYANRHHIGEKIRFQTKVVEVNTLNAQWEVIFENGKRSRYEGVICATGITWHPNFPKVKGEFTGEYIHSFAYKEPSFFKGKRVLIIGAGNSGCDIACDAARAAEKAFISLRRGYYFLPKYTLGIPSDLFKEKFSTPFKALDTHLSEFLLNKVLVGNLENFGLPKPDHHLMESHPIMNSRLLHYLGHGDIQAKKNIAEFQGNVVIFEDGSQEEVDVVVAATGYKRVFPFLSDELLDSSKDSKEIDLHLEVFSKKHDNLFFMGGIEVSSAIFGLLNLQGRLIASYLQAKENTSTAFQKFLLQKSKKVSLKGKNRYIDSLRHQRYVDKDLYRARLKKEIQQLGQ
ncbi:MAG: NAD(P)-binding domain-containing protein [Bacteroidota bacterium]